MTCIDIEQKEIYFQSILNCIDYKNIAKNHALRTLHIAILLKGKKIVYVAKNDRRKLGTVHAEENICKLFYFSSKYTLLVIRVLPDGKLSNSKPCTRCIEIMKRKGHKHIWYSTDFGGFCKERLDYIDGRYSSFDRSFRTSENNEERNIERSRRIKRIKSC